MNIKLRARNLIASDIFLPLALFVTIALINILLQPTFFKVWVIRSNFASFTPVIMAAIGQAIILLSGNLDLSAGAGISLLNCVMASTMKPEPPGMNILALLLTFAAALAIGGVNGVLVGYFRLPALITTFATSAVWFGVALSIRPSPGGFVAPWVSKLFQAHVWIISFPLLMIVGGVFLWRMIKRRKIGRYIYAVGSNEEGAFDSGINTRRIKLYAYMIGWGFMFLSAFSITAQMSSGDAYMGSPFTMNSIAASVVGGISLAGGRGAVGGAALGAVILSMIMNVIFYANLPSFLQEFVKGLIIVLALGTTVLYKRKRS